jgi:hypothetical protein
MRVGVSADQRPPRSHEVEVSFAVGVKYIGAAASSEKQRDTADGFPRPYRTVNAARNPGLGAVKKSTRTIS